MASLVSDGRFRGDRGHHLLALFDEPRLRRILARMLDEERFLSPYGIRSLSRWHKDHPYVFWAGGAEQRVGYLPAESDSGQASVAARHHALGLREEDYADARVLTWVLRNSSRLK